MRRGARSAATLAVLSAILVIGGAWGWSEVTKPFPGKAEPPICVDTAVSAGERIYPGQVVVSVFNAGTRDGLAGRTMGLFTDHGFVAGDSGNAPSGARVPWVQIWTTDPKSPAVRLVASHLGRNIIVVRRQASGAGVVVVVGDGFKKLVHGREKVRAASDATICSPSIG